MEEQITQHIINNFPWISLVTASVLATTILTAVALLCYPGKERPERGWKFRLWIFVVCFTAALIVVPIPIEETFTYSGLQILALNFLFISSGAVFVYTFVGYYIFEKKIGPWLIAHVNKRFDTQLGYTVEDKLKVDNIKANTKVK